jgi:hypothetical protein
MSPKFTARGKLPYFFGAGLFQYGSIDPIFAFLRSIDSPNNYPSVYVGFGGMFAIAVAGGIDPAFAHEHPGIQKVLVGLTFPVCYLATPFR